jgi:hypothetical protein
MRADGEWRHRASSPNQHGIRASAVRAGSWWALLIYGSPEVLILPIDFHVGAHQRSTPCSVSDFLLQRAASSTMQQTFNRKNEEKLIIKTNNKKFCSKSFLKSYEEFFYFEAKIFKSKFWKQNF